MKKGGAKVSREPHPQLLGGVDWDDLVPRLLQAAYKVSRRLGLYRFHTAPSSEDLVQEALASVLEGRRTLNEAVSLFHNLYWIMHSQAHAFTKRQRATGGFSGTRHVDFDESVGTPSTAPPTPVEDAEFREAVLELVADDPLMTAMVRIWLDNGDVPARDLAEALNVPVEVIYTRTRKCKRRLLKSDLLD